MCPGNVHTVNGADCTAHQGEFWPAEAIPGRILFHQDFDGVCSAAVLVAFFDTELSLQPVRYTLKKGWLRKKVRDAAVVDFLYHPDALWWFDHHETTFINPSVKALYRPAVRHRWDTSYASCPALILDVLGESVDVSALERAFVQWVRWSDVIDGAKYRDPKQAVLGSEAAILINQALAESPNPKLRVHLVRRIAQGLQPEAVANDNAVARHWRTWRRQTARALAVMEERLHAVGNVGFCDVSDVAIPFVRYGVYYFVPEVPYSVIAYRSTRGRPGYWISLSANPWVNSHSNPISLASLASRYGGGGRRNVAAIKCLSAAECATTARDIVQLLTHPEEIEEKEGSGHA